MIPFKVGVFVTGKDFCGREKEISTLREYIESAFRIFITGERRTGKSSLIMETRRRMQGWKFAYIDLRSVATMEKLCERTANGIYSALKSQSALKKITGAIASLRPAISLDPQTGDLKISISPDAKPANRNFHQLLEVAGKRRTTVIFDEFQDIMELPDYRTILAGMRTVIQNQPDTAYLFSGSILHRMERLFTDPDSAFFRNAQKIQLGRIDSKEFENYIRDRFWKGCRKISPSAMDMVLSFGRGNPGDIQRLCIGIWDVTEKNSNISQQDVLNGIGHICNLETEAFSDKLASLSPNQIKCLSRIAEMNSSVVINSQFVENSGLKSYSAVKSALQGLQQKRVLLRRNREWKISMPFFINWYKTSGLA